MKKPENEQAELLETFDGHLVDVKSCLAQKKTMSIERAYQCFFETCVDLKKNRQNPRNDLLQFFIMAEKCGLFYGEAAKLEEELDQKI